MARSTRTRVASATMAVPRMTLETVDFETPARSATSISVVTARFPSARARSCGGFLRGGDQQLDVAARLHDRRRDRRALGDGGVEGAELIAEGFLVGDAILGGFEPQWTVGAAALAQGEL